MIIKKATRIMALLVGMGTVFSALNACITTFINDSNGIIRVYNKNDHTSFDLRKNGRRRFVSSDFKVLVQQPKTESFRLLYACKQNECGDSGNPQIKFSDLESGQGAAHMFIITKNEKPHISMVKGLPMIQKKTCVPCGDERQ